MEIYNCHIHTFTVDHVPDKFVGYGIDNLLRIKAIRGVVSFLLKNILPFSDRDLLDRYVRFMKIANKDNQEKVLKVVRGYYPESTKFVILPMDMEYADMGYVKNSLEEQHKELAELCKKPKYQGKLFPFVAVDPRRDGILEMTKNLIENEGCKGIKIYPPLGYFPQDPRLDPVYEYAQANDLPVMTHCSRGGVYTKAILKTRLKSTLMPR